ncbi:winged helix-turn-helix transcriptional regulator [Arachidicoccus ginsenosidimutans]
MISFGNPIEVHPRVEYRLTETDIKLSLILLKIRKWAEECLMSNHSNK